MNKGLRDQIMVYMPKKSDKICKDAQKYAEEAFEECSKKIGKGEFTPIAKDTIVVSDLYTGTCDANSLWRNFYNEKITALFSAEGITAVKVAREFKIYGYLYLKF